MHTTAARARRRADRDRDELDGGGRVHLDHDTGTTDISSLDVLADTPEPDTAVAACLADGFRLANGLTVRGDTGLLLVGGEAFAWRPWGGAADPARRLVNAKGQWELADPEAALGLLSLAWPRPDLLLLGLGAEMRPLSPATRRAIVALGVRVEVLDTRNAAAQFNLLATERGVDNVAAALVPAGPGKGGAL